jgi:hypothetical protein
VAEKFLNISDVISVLKQMRSEGMAGVQEFTEAIQQVSPTSAVGRTFLLVLGTSSSINPLFSTGGFLIRQNSD